MAALALLAGCGAEPEAGWRPGAATARNVAALAGNGDDLILPRRESPRDALRRDAAIGQYAQRRADAPAEAETVRPKP